MFGLPGLVGSNIEDYFASELAQHVDNCQSMEKGRGKKYSTKKS